MMIQGALLLPWVLWLVLRLALPAGPYEMDAAGKEGRFYPLLILFSVFFYTVLSLALIGATFNVAHGVDWRPGLMLLFSAVYALLFNGLTLFFYEGYLTSKAAPQPKSSYSTGKYATILSLGFSAVVLLLVGTGWMAMGVVK